MRTEITESCQGCDITSGAKRCSRSSMRLALATTIRPRRRVLRPGARVWRWWPTGGLQELAGESSIPTVARCRYLTRLPAPMHLCEDLRIRHRQAEGGSQPTERAPNDRRVLDKALDPESCANDRRADMAEQSNAAHVVIEIDFGIGPIELVRFVADREIEARASLFNCVAHQLLQMRDAGTEMRRRAFG